MLYNYNELLISLRLGEYPSNENEKQLENINVKKKNFKGARRKQRKFCKE